MQNTGNFTDFYVARFEVSSKYGKLKCCFIKTLLHTFKVWKYLQIKTEKHKHFLLQKYINIFIYLNKNIF